MHNQIIKDGALNVFINLEHHYLYKAMRDTKILEQYTKAAERKSKEMNIFRHLKKEVETNANGTREYVIKKGINKGKIAK